MVDHPASGWKVIGFSPDGNRFHDFGTYKNGYIQIICGVLKIYEIAIECPSKCFPAILRFPVIHRRISYKPFPFAWWILRRAYWACPGPAICHVTPRHCTMKQWKWSTLVSSSIKHISTGPMLNKKAKCFPIKHRFWWFQCFDIYIPNPPKSCDVNYSFWTHNKPVFYTTSMRYNRLQQWL